MAAHNDSILRERCGVHGDEDEGPSTGVNHANASWSSLMEIEGEDDDNNEYTEEIDRMQEVIRQLKGEGFDRFHSKKMVESDRFNVYIGTTIYLLVLFSIRTSACWKSIGAMIFLCLTSLWPHVLLFYGTDTFLRWRDFVLCLHYGVHYIWAPQFLLSEGVHARSIVQRQRNPVLFLLFFFITSTIPWHSLHGFTYKTSRLYKFLITRLLMLYFTSGHEAEYCRSMVTKHPIPSVEVFKNLHAFLESLANSVAMSVGINLRVETAESGTDGVEGYTECKHIMLFLLYFLGIAVPAFHLYMTEHLEWKRFINSNIDDITWPGGPSRDEMLDGLEELRDEISREVRQGCNGADVLGWLSFLACGVIIWVFAPYLRPSPILRFW